ncbi:MAG: response regulator [Rhodocyclaceae bacterium]|nr:response regulator [Rhodocyclaceae bacterium]
MTELPINRAALLDVFIVEARGRLDRALDCLEHGPEGCVYDKVHQEFDSLHGGARAVDLEWLERDSRVIAGYARFLHNLGRAQVTASAHALLLETVRALAEQCRSPDIAEPNRGPDGRLNRLLDSLESALREHPSPTLPAMPLTLLVVDDSATSRLLFRAHLPAEEGHTVVEAEDMDSALRMAESTRPQVVFMDYNMPTENGVAIAGRMRERGCAAAFILLTANVQQAVLDEARAAGFVGVLEKPVNRDKIAAVLGSLRFAQS